MDPKTLQKMKFIYNAVENGWKVKKQDDKYVFTQMHNGKKEVFNEDYLEKFIIDNMNADPVIKL